MTPREARRAMKNHRTRFILVFTRSDFRRVFGSKIHFSTVFDWMPCAMADLNAATVSLERLETAGLGRIVFCVAHDIERADQGAVPTDPPVEPAGKQKAVLNPKRRC